MVSSDFMNDTKRCVICGSEYRRKDFPHCFDRMVTCGDITCAGQRRYSLWKERYERDKKNRK